MIARGERITVTFDDVAYRGEALGRVEGQVVFAERGIDGETAIVEVFQTKKDYAVGRVVDVLEPSPHRVTPRCPYFGPCGGCQWQHVSYEHQLELKTHTVGYQMHRIARMTDAPVLPAIGAAAPWNYRNHIRFTVSKGRLGFVQRQSHRFVPTGYCFIADPRINWILEELWERHPDTWHLNVRCGVNTGQLSVQPQLDLLNLPFETGQPYHEEDVLGARFRISTPSFFQTNTAQAERLASLVIERVLPARRGVVVDAYAGVGTFSVLLATHFERVIAIEESRQAVEDALVNAAGSPNVECIVGKAEDALPKVERRPDVVILDPPRAGCHPKVLAALRELSPPRIVYVSCDPATLARDLKILCDGGYHLDEVQPLDMFPQTYHIEAVATLSLP